MPTGNSLANTSTEELAGALWKRRTTSVGVGYAGNEVDRPEKAEARAEVLERFGPAYFRRGLSILTMPGLHWTFERLLLARREAGRLRAERGPKRTFICGIEREEVIYRASMKFMPGVSQYGDSHMAICPSPSCATTSVRNRLVSRYHRCSFEDYAEMPELGETGAFDGAWLDFNGPLTERRLLCITRFWNRAIRSTLVVTCLAPRQSGNISNLVMQSGGPGRLLQMTCQGSWARRFLEYRDTVPMWQVTLVRK